MAFIDNQDKLTLRVGNIAVSHLDTYFDKEDDEADRPTWTYQLHDYPDAIVNSSKVVARRPRLLERAGQAHKVDRILTFEKPPGHEYCSHCGFRPASYFYPDTSRPSGYRKICIACENKMSGRYYDEHREVIKAKQRVKYAAKVETEQGRSPRRYFKAA